MSDETYNGYANRETWAFNLHWQNDQGLYNEVLDVARDAINRDPYTRGLSDDYLGRKVVEYVTAHLPDLSPELWENMRSDVGSFWRIDYAEVGACVRESLDVEAE